MGSRRDSSAPKTSVSQPWEKSPTAAPHSLTAACASPLIASATHCRHSAVPTPLPSALCNMTPLCGCWGGCGSCSGGARGGGAWDPKGPGWLPQSPGDPARPARAPEYAQPTFWCIASVGTARVGTTCRWPCTQPAIGPPPAGTPAVKPAGTPRGKASPSVPWPPCGPAGKPGGRRCPLTLCQRWVNSAWRAADRANSPSRRALSATSASRLLASCSRLHCCSAACLPNCSSFCLRTSSARCSAASRRFFRCCSAASALRISRARIASAWCARSASPRAARVRSSAARRRCAEAQRASSPARRKKANATAGAQRPSQTHTPPPAVPAAPLPGPLPGQLPCAGGLSCGLRRKQTRPLASRAALIATIRESAVCRDLLAPRALASKKSKSTAASSTRRQ
mmetsp:Transcript_42002/g.94894  ORF Transcript_42002/g.94894 Transcript_42002/m.94894 type:complete len:397 (-) Transcript_42002:235-1425(-)